MFYPYMTLGDLTEVIHTEWNGKNTTVRFEKPDEVFCFKTLDCTVPGYNVSNIIGFTKEEVQALINYCQDNSDLLVKYSKCGGISNA